ncbi:MAG: GlsB/YeaQ/YmgE family stress response membrane protein [Pseudomonadota bacterium]
MAFIFWIIVGGIAGWIAEQIMKANHGLLTNVILGVLGAFVGGWLFGLIGGNMGDGWIGSIITATVGAVVLIYVYRLIRGEA